MATYRVEGNIKNVLVFVYQCCNAKESSTIMQSNEGSFNGWVVACSPHPIVMFPSSQLFSPQSPVKRSGTLCGEASRRSSRTEARVGNGRGEIYLGDSRGDARSDGACGCRCRLGGDAGCTVALARASERSRVTAISCIRYSVKPMQTVWMVFCFRQRERESRLPPMCDIAPSTPRCERAHLCSQVCALWRRTRARRSLENCVE